MNKFYCVSFKHSTSEHFYFKDHENACAFLLDCYFDDYEVTAEEAVIAVNNEIADNDCIDDYGYISECYFED